MGKEFSISSFEEMGQKANKLQQLSEEYREIADDLLDRAQTMGSAWEGADNEAFVNQIMGIQDNLRSMSEKLSSASQALNTQKDNYMKMQEDNISSVGQLGN